MSNQHPDYLLLQQRSRVLAWLWWLGHVGRRLSLAGAVLAPLGLVAMSLAQRNGSSISLGRGLIHALACFAACAGLLVASVILKNFALKRGGRF